MRRIKVICTTKSIANKESEHCVELKSIEVRNPKMHSIRFALSVNWIQMWRIKVIRTRKTMTNKESQQCVESKSTEVLKKKMLQIWFGVVVNWIQRRRNRVASMCEKGEVEDWESRHQTTLAPDRNKCPDGWNGSWLSHFQQQFDDGNPGRLWKPYKVAGSTCQRPIDRRLRIFESGRLSRSAETELLTMNHD
jgi:hypothetical protein